MGQVHVFRRVVYFLKHHVLLRSLRLLIISIPILVLLFLLTALYLGLIGFPGRVTEAWVKKLNDQGVNNPDGQDLPESVGRFHGGRFCPTSTTPIRHWPWSKPIVLSWISMCSSGSMDIWASNACT